MNFKIIAATKNELFETALLSSVEWIFDLDPDIATIQERAYRAHKLSKKYFIHFDLATGIGKDKSGLAFAMDMGIDGIVSTRVNIVKMARELGLFTIQRFFIVDSHSVETTLEGIRSAKPDMIEIMPGTVYKVISKLSKTTDTQIIAGGLIETQPELEEALAAGACAVSTSRTEFWK